jgi:hypothetical protein
MAWNPLRSSTGALLGMQPFDCFSGALVPQSHHVRRDGGRCFDTGSARDLGLD